MDRTYNSAHPQFRFKLINVKIYSQFELRVQLQDRIMSEEIVDNLADPMEHFEDAVEAPVGDIDNLEAASEPPADAAPGGTDESANKKKRKKKGTGDGCNKKVPLTFHEALAAHYQKGLYVDLQSGEIRCSCNHKPTTKWDVSFFYHSAINPFTILLLNIPPFFVLNQAYSYTRHFTFKIHKKVSLSS